MWFLIYANEENHAQWGYSLSAVIGVESLM